jgi:hypothetical protein
MGPGPGGVAPPQGEPQPEAAEHWVLGKSPTRTGPAGPPARPPGDVELGVRAVGPGARAIEHATADSGVGNRALVPRQPNRETRRILRSESLTTPLGATGERAGSSTMTTFDHNFKLNFKDHKNNMSRVGILTQASSLVSQKSACPARKFAMHYLQCTEERFIWQTHSEFVEVSSFLTLRTTVEIRSLASSVCLLHLA